MRILLFLLTNLAVVIVVGTVWRLLGFDSFLEANGVGLDFNALLVFCALFGMGGSLVSLFISKWMAKRSTGTRIIEAPSNRTKNGWFKRFDSLQRMRVLACPRWVFSHPMRPMPSLPDGTEIMPS
jgi:heat shock protein HtpX